MEMSLGLYDGGWIRQGSAFLGGVGTRDGAVLVKMKTLNMLMGGKVSDLVVRKGSLEGMLVNEHVGKAQMFFEIWKEKYEGPKEMNGGVGLDLENWLVGDPLLNIGGWVTATKLP